MAEPLNPAVAKPPRVMADATVLFAGIGWPRWSYEILRHALRNDFQLLLSPLVIEQVRRNLGKKRPNHVLAFEAWLALVPFELVPDPEIQAVMDNKTLVRDLSDVPIALAAIRGRAEYLVSEDKDLTDEKTTRELRQHLQVMRPVTFLHEVMDWSHEELEKVRHRSWPVEPT